MADQKKNIRGEEALTQLMERHDQRDGQRLWEEYEAACETGQIPELSDGLDKACKEIIAEHFSGKPQQKEKTKIFSTVSRLAVCALMLLTLVTLNYMMLTCMKWVQTVCACIRLTLSQHSVSN